MNENNDQLTNRPIINIIILNYFFIIGNKIDIQTSYVWQ